MLKYDVTDEAVINASPEVVYNAIIDVYDGKTNWWMPHLSSKLCEGDSSCKMGALYELTIHSIFPIKFKIKTVEAKKNEMLRVYYVEGSFVGKGLWKFESIEGKTNLSLRWLTNPEGLMRIVAPFYPLAKSHSAVMQAGYRKLNKFLKSHQLHIP